MQGTVPSAQSLLILVGSAVVFGYLAVRFFRRVAAAYAAGRIQLDLVPVAVRSAERGWGLATADEPPRRSSSRPVRTRSVRSSACCFRFWTALSRASGAGLSLKRSSARSPSITAASSRVMQMCLSASRARSAATR